MVSLLVLGCALVSLLCLLGVRSAWRGRRVGGTLVGLLSAALFVVLAALFGAVGVGIRGYRALTHEVVAATIRTEPIGPQRFRATVTLADGRLLMFDLAGDAVYVDAHVLKWRPIANLLGFHTVYELDRIAGRYRALADEQQRERTVHSLAARKPFDLFDVARASWLLRPLVDAEYGSATFIGATEPATMEVRVSTTGLLVRPVRVR